MQPTKSKTMMAQFEAISRDASAMLKKRLSYGFEPDGTVARVETCGCG